MKKLLAVLLVVAAVAGQGFAGGKKDSGVVNLEFWLRDTRPTNVDAMKEIIANFERDNPGIKINLVLTPWDSVEQKTATAIAAGTLPDLSQLNQTGAADYGAKGVLLNLDSRYAAWTAKNDVAAISLSQAMYNGHYYGVPWFAGSNVMFYNKEIFKKNGIVDDKGEAKPPVTWAEFIDVAKKLTQDTNKDGQIDQWGFVVRGNISLTIPVREFMLAAGDGLWVDTASNNKVVIDTPKNLNGLQFYLDLYRTLKVVPPDTPSVDYTAEEQYFLSGKTAMMFNGPWSLGTYYNAPFEWGAALEPMSERHAAHIGGCPVGIFNTTKHPDEAWKFATYLLNAESQRIWAVKYGCGLPASKAIQEEAKKDPVIKVFVEGIQAAERDGVTPPPQIAEWVTIERATAPVVFQKALLGELTAKQCLETLQRDIEQLMKK
jgi:multiple sugar transport system substrate-binding protein